MPNLPTIAIVEDEVLLLGLMREYLVKSQRFEVVGCYTSGTEAVAKLTANPCDIVLLDLQLPDMNGITVVQQLGVRVSNPPKFIVLSNGTNPLVVKQLLKSGVRGILQKGLTAAEVLSACERVLRGGVCLELSQGDMVDLATAPVAEHRPSLTAREYEVLDLVARGRRSKEIAEALGLSTRTVEKHRENLMRKLGVNETTGLVRYAMKEGLLNKSRPLAEA